MQALPRSDEGLWKQRKSFRSSLPWRVVGGGGGNVRNKANWQDMGYDSAWAAEGIIGNREEQCINDPRPPRVVIQDITLGHTGEANRTGYWVDQGTLREKYRVGISTAFQRRLRQWLLDAFAGDKSFCATRLSDSTGSWYPLRLAKAPHCILPRPI